MKMIMSPNRANRAATFDDMLRLFEVKGSKWPDEGCEPRVIQGIKVWVDPRLSKPQFVRTRCSCPTCGRVMALSRLPQHNCGRRLTRGTHGQQVQP